MIPVRPDVWTQYVQWTQTHQGRDTLKETIALARKTLQTRKSPPWIPLEALAKIIDQGPTAYAETAAMLANASAAMTQAKGRYAPILELGWATVFLLAELTQTPPEPSQAGITYYNLGTVLLAIGNPEAGLEMFTQALDKLPPEHQAACADAKAKALIQLNRASEAVQFLQPILTQSSPPDSLRLTYAQALQKAGQPIAAQTGIPGIIESTRIKRRRSFDD